MALLNKNLDLFNSIMIIIIIMVLLCNFIGGYFNYIEKFNTYGFVACPPQFTKVGSTNNIYYNGNIGIGTATPSNKLDVNGDINISSGSKFKINNNDLSYSDLAGTLPQQFTKVESTNNIYYNEGNIGINNISPQADLHVTGYSLTEGILGVSGGYLYSKNNDKLQDGSLNIGSTTKNYGGSPSGWNNNTAGLMLECANNTEIVVHDNDQNSLASLMYYEGDTNTIHIGRDMSWGSTNVVIHGNISVNGYITNNNDGLSNKIYNGMRVAQKYSYNSKGQYREFAFIPQVHNQICVKIKIDFRNVIYTAVARNTPASGSVEFIWASAGVSDLDSRNFRIEYPYQNNRAPVFIFKNLRQVETIRIVVLHYNNIANNDNNDYYDDMIDY